VVTWFVFRVFIAARSQGQSFGKWLMSIRVVDADFGKTADFGAFIKREIFVFTCSIFLIETFTTTFIVFAWIPFAADVAFAVVDNEKRQALHDRLSGTISIQSRKGFAVDQKLGKLFNQAGQQATKLYQSRQEQGFDRDRQYNDAPRDRPKRRPRTKSRPPQDFARDYEPKFDRDFFADDDAYDAPSKPRKSTFKDDMDEFDDWNQSQAYGGDNFSDPEMPDPQQNKRSARRPRRR